MFSDVKMPDKYTVGKESNAPPDLLCLDQVFSFGAAPGFSVLDPGNQNNRDPANEEANEAKAKLLCHQVKGLKKEREREQEKC